MPVAALERMIATCEEACRGLLGERRGPVVDRTELLAVAVRLLEVVAEDLVELDQRRAVDARASRRSARAARRGSPWAAPRRRCRGSAGGGTGRRRRPATSGCSGRTRSLRTSATSWPSTGAAVGASATTAPRWKTWPSTAPRSSTPRSAAVELVEARGEQRLDRRRDRDFAIAALGCHRDHLLDEQRVAAGRLEDPARGAPRSTPSGERVDELGRLVRRERLEQRGGGVQLAAAPRRPHVEQVGARHAEEQDRRVAAQVGDVLDQVEEGRLAPVQVVEDDHDRPLGGPRLEQLAEGPGDLLRRDRRRCRRRGSRRAGRSRRRRGRAA